MNDQEWARIVRLLVTVLAVALASIPAALALGLGGWLHELNIMRLNTSGALCILGV